MAFRNPSVELTAGKSYVLCFVHLLVIYSFPVYWLGKGVDFFFIFTFSETGVLIFAYWEFSFQISNHKHGMAATIKKHTLENSKGFSVKTTNLNLFTSHCIQDTIIFYC